MSFDTDMKAAVTSVLNEEITVIFTTVLQTPSDFSNVRDDNHGPLSSCLTSRKMLLFKKMKKHV